MSSTIPPNPNLDVFNNAYWTTDETAVTVAYANKNYLKFPVSQSAKETISGEIDVNGLATFKNNIVVTDGVTTNTINEIGYTTRNSVQNITHYLNFSDSAATGTGAIQKNASLNCNPSTGTISATNLNGAINVAETNAASTFYPVMVSSVGNSSLFADTATSPLSYTPSNGTLTANNLISINVTINSGSLLLPVAAVGGTLNAGVLTFTNTTSSIQSFFFNFGATSNTITNIRFSTNLRTNGTFTMFIRNTDAAQTQTIQKNLGTILTLPIVNNLTADVTITGLNEYILITGAFSSTHYYFNIIKMTP